MKKTKIWLMMFIFAILQAHAQTQFNTNGGGTLSSGGYVIFPNAIYFVPGNVTIVDNAPPIILTLSEIISNESANVSWTTNENANYTFRISTGQEFGNATFTISFFQNITGLQNNTQFSYNITACDIFGNCNTTINFNFTTLQNAGPVLFIICTDTVGINTSCTMVSPVITTCTNYTIHNLTGTLIKNDTNLTTGFVPGTFFFVFNESEGQYVVTFCDGSTKEVLVTAISEDDNMAFSGIGILVAAMMFFTVYAASTILTRDDEGKIIQMNKIIKFLLYSLGLFILYFASQLAYGIALENSFSGSVTSSLLTIHWLILILGPILLIIIFWVTFVQEFIALWEWVQKMLGINPDRRRKNK